MASNGKAEYVTLEVLKEMMEIQDRAYRSTLQILVNDMKSEIKSVKRDVEELKLSTQFMSSKFEDQKINIEQRKMKVEQIEDRVKILESNLSNSSLDDEYYDPESRLEDLENKHEYLENMSRRNSIKILGLPEDKNHEKSWEDTEQIVKETINKELEISSEEIRIERAHRVGKPQDGRPRPVVARFCSWKQIEAILAIARKKKPKNVRFFQDLSSRTLQRRAEKIPKLIQERKKAMWHILFWTDLSFTKARRKGLMAISYHQMALPHEIFLSSSLLLLNLNDSSHCVERSTYFSILYLIEE